MNIVLYQPDIPQNTGSFVRLCACLGLPLHIIEPCGFVLDEKKLRRVAMDYSELVTLHRHTNFSTFLSMKEVTKDSRLILLTTQSTIRYTDVTYQPDDFLVLGRESSGVPKEVHDKADLRITIPMVAGARSLNVVNAASMVVGEAMRQSFFRTCSESFQGASENPAFREPHRKCMLTTCEAEAQKSGVSSKPSKDFEQVLSNIVLER